LLNILFTQFLFGFFSSFASNQIVPLHSYKAPKKIGFLEVAAALKIIDFQCFMYYNYASTFVQTQTCVYITNVYFAVLNIKNYVNKSFLKSYNQKVYAITQLTPNPNNPTDF
jgi:hypothetical protein